MLEQRPPPPRKSRANAERMENARNAFAEALATAAVKGYFGEVRVSVTLQDGVVQKLNVENSRVIR